jgi:Phosphodiester glycosidase
MAFAAVAPGEDGRCRRVRVRLADGALTTVYVACHVAARTEIRVAVLRGRRLASWCAAHGVGEALVGGFFVRPDEGPPSETDWWPLGEVRTGGVARRSVPFDAPWDGVRACVHVQGGHARIARRNLLPRAPRGDLLQAGPLLVAGGEPVFDPDLDLEGFRAGAHQFDPDITAGRHPRAALGLAPGRVFAVATDGRADDDAGLTLSELATAMAALGCETALNLDGGGSTTLISGGRLRNRPRGDYEVPEPGGRPLSTALLFVPV